MKTFAANQKRSAPAARKAHPYVHHPMGPVQQRRQTAMRKILRPDEGQAKPDIDEPDGQYEQEPGRLLADLPVSAISGIPPSRHSGAPPIQRSENEEPEEELQRQPEEEEEEPIQAKLIQKQPDNEGEEEPVQARLIQRQVADMGGIRPSRFGYVGPEVKAQKAEIRRILRSTGAQAKLTIGRPNDIYEQEADRIADQVMAMPDPKLQRQPESEEEEETLQAKPLANQITPLVQRQEEPPEEPEEELQAKFADEHMQRQPMEEEEEEGLLQTKQTSGSTPKVGPDFESRIESLSGRGEPLAPRTRADFETHFGADFSQVRVHTDAAVARELNAQAFTHRQDIFFGAGRYNPVLSEGKRLIAHELTHVLQQRGRLQRKAETRTYPEPSLKQDLSKADRWDAPENRESLGFTWYIELTPSTPVIPVGTKVRFTLKTTPYRTPGLHNWWNTRVGIPIFGVQREGDKPIERFSGPLGEPWAVKTFSQVGRHKMYFRGAPGVFYRYGKPLHISIELDVVKHLTTETMKALERRGALRQDISRAERATGSEFVLAFKRIAVWRAIEILNQNKMAGLKLLRKYTPYGGVEAALSATRELLPIAKLDETLAYEVDSLKYKTISFEDPSEPWVHRIYKKARRKVDWAKVKRLELIRAHLVNAFPAIALRRKALLTAYSDPRRAQKSLVVALRGVMADCDKTRRALAIGKLDIFEVPEVVAEVRHAMYVDKRQRLTLDRAIREHKVSGFLKGVGSAGVSLGLLLIPGLGPYLSAAVGLASAGISWKHAQILESAAGAGVRKGIVSSEAAASAKFWAMIEFVLAGLEVGQMARTAFKAAKGIKPHVPVVAQRTVPVPMGATGEITTEVTQVTGAVAREIPEGYIVDVLEQTFGKKIEWKKSLLPPYTNRDKFLHAWWKAGGTGRAPLAFFDGEMIHIGPRVKNLRHVFHEAIHKVAHTNNPLLRNMIGDFLCEGMTERLAQRLLGRASKEGLIYPENVAFVGLLETKAKVGRQVIERALLRGDYRALHRVARKAFGGSWEKTRTFFRLARQLGPNGKEQGGELLGDLLNLLSKGRRTTGKVARRLFRGD